MKKSLFIRQKGRVRFEDFPEWLVIFLCFRKNRRKQKLPSKKIYESLNNQQSSLYIYLSEKQSYKTNKPL